MLYTYQVEEGYIFDSLLQCVDDIIKKQLITNQELLVQLADTMFQSFKQLCQNLQFIAPKNQMRMKYYLTLMLQGKLISYASVKQSFPEQVVPTAKALNRNNSQKKLRVTSRHNTMQTINSKALFLTQNLENMLKLNEYQTVC